MQERSGRLATEMVIRWAACRYCGATVPAFERAAPSMSLRALCCGSAASGDGGDKGIGMSSLWYRRPDWTVGGG